MRSILPALCMVAALTAASQARAISLSDTLCSVAIPSIKDDLPQPQEHVLTALKSRIDGLDWQERRKMRGLKPTPLPSIRTSGAVWSIDPGADPYTAFFSERWRPSLPRTSRTTNASMNDREVPSWVDQTATGGIILSGHADNGHSSAAQQKSLSLFIAANLRLGRIERARSKGIECI